MTEPERHATILRREENARPLHSPPRFASSSGVFHLTASCFEHEAIVGASVERMQDFSDALFAAIAAANAMIHAWCVLPNHYHLLVSVENLRHTTKRLGQLHGRVSHQWNGEDDARGRTVWHVTADRAMRTERHYWVAMNYIHHSPVRHGYVEQWQQWPWSSAARWLEEVGREEAERVWREFPLKGFGEKWDP